MSVTEAVIRVTGRRPISGSLLLRTLRAFLVIGVLIGLVFMVRGLLPMINQPVTQIQVVGRLTHLSPTEVAATANIASGTRLFDVQMKAMEQRVEALPWVAKAIITRQWPSQIRIRITERTPVARWDGHKLIDTNNQVFEPKRDALSASRWKALPQLSGPPGQGQDVMDTWKELSAALADGPFALAGLREDRRGGWIARCRSGVILRFGRGNPAAKLKLLRYTAAPALSQKLNLIAAIDLRYTNGFAVRWLASAHSRLPATSTQAAGEKPNR